MKTRKKILIIVLVLVLIAAIGVGAFFFLKNRKQGTVDVYNVSTLNNADYYAGDSQLTGTVTSDYVQEVNLDSSQEVKKIYVKQGDVVKEGDKLLKYNVEERELDLKLQKLQIKSSKAEIQNMKKELEKLKNTKAVGAVDTSGVTMTNASLNLNTMKAQSVNYLMSSTGVNPVKVSAVTKEGTTEGTTQKAQDQIPEATTEGTTKTKQDTTPEEESQTKQNSISQTKEDPAPEATTEKKKDPQETENTTPTTSLTDVNQRFTSDNDGKSVEKPFLFRLVQTKEKEDKETDDKVAGSISGELIKYLRDNKIYADFRQYLCTLDEYNKMTQKQKDNPDNYVHFVLTPKTVLTKEISVKETYTVEKMQSMLNKLYRNLTEVKQKASTSGDGKSADKKIVYLLVRGDEDKDEFGLIKGSVINDLLEAGSYAVFQEYASLDAFMKNEDPVATFTLKPSTLFSEEIPKKGYYSVDGLNNIEIKTDTIKITPGRSTVKKGKSYKFKVSLSGANTDALSVTWELKRNKSSLTTLVNGVLTVGADETASYLKMKVSAGGKSTSRILKVKNNASGSTSSGGSGGSSGGSGGDSGSSVDTYTAAELKQAISDKEDEISEAQEDLDQARINYKEAKKEVDAATVKATIAGTVTTAYTKDSLPTDGSAVVIVRAEDGMYVKTSVSEMSLDTVKVGGTITCTSYDTNQEYTAVVKEVSDFPQSSSSMDTATNPNNSYYPIVAYISDAEGLSTGAQVTVTYNQQSMGTIDADAIYLQKAYVRSEGKKYYVYKQGKNKKLEKQYVQTGGTLYGQYLEITSGLTQDDNIAFPYGKNVKNGAKTKVSDDTDDIIY